MQKKLDLKYLYIQLLQTCLFFVLCCTIFSALLVLISVSMGSGRDPRADSNDLGMLLKAAQCQKPSAPDWLPHSARRKSPVLYLQTSVDNIKPEGHDLSLQGSQIRLYLVSHFLNHVRSRSHMLAPSFFVSLGTCMTVGLRILLAESFKASAGDRCIILIEVHESCVLNSPCCLGSFLQWLMYQYHWSTVIQITCTINVIKLMSCWYYPGFLFEFFGLPCVAWCGLALCCPLPFLSPASPELPSLPACLPASALWDPPSAQPSPNAKLLCKGRSMGSEYPGNGKVFLRWSHVLEIKGEHQIFLCCSPCHCVMSLKGLGLTGERNRLMDRLLPCLQETAQIALLLPETLWCLMPFLV